MSLQITISQNDVKCCLLDWFGIWLRLKPLYDDSQRIFLTLKWWRATFLLFSLLWSKALKLKSKEEF